MGRGHLDRLVLTHYDTDHISGVETLLSRVDVDTLVVPGLPDSAAGEAPLEAARAQGTTILVLQEETAWELGTGTLTVYPRWATARATRRG